MYREMVEDSSLSQQFCSCANDVLENGVLNQLLEVAKRFKYAARDGRQRCWSITLKCGPLSIKFKYGKNTPTRAPAQPIDLSPRPLAPLSKRSTDGDLARLEQEYLENTNMETADALLAAGGWHPNTVTGPEQWITYSAMLTSSLPTNQMIRDFATFIYCKLNHPESKDY